MEQKSQIQMGIGQYKDAAMPLKTRGTPALSNKVCNFFLAQGATNVFSMETTNSKVDS